MNLKQPLSIEPRGNAGLVRRVLTVGFLVTLGIVEVTIPTPRMNAREAAIATQCQFIVRPVTRSVGAAGGAGSVTILAAEGCSWTATSNAPWIELVGLNPGGVLGPGRLNYSVLASTEVTQRSGTMTVAGQTITITQAGATASGCAVAPISTGQSVNGSLVPGDCLSPVRVKDGSHPLADRFSFNATAGQPIVVSLTSADFDTYLYILDANGSIIAQNDDSGASSRVPAGKGSFVLPTSGTFTIEVTSFATGVTGNYALSLTMPSGNCSYAINPGAQAFAVGGGSGAIAVTTQTGCSWSAVCNNGWCAITSSGSSGVGSVNFSVAANPGLARTGTITVAGLTFTVAQAGSNGSACPTIASLAPLTGAPGASVSINGANFTGATGIKFGGNVSAQFAIVSDTKLTATVPGGAASGPLTITKPTCPDAQTGAFTVNGVVASVSAANYNAVPLASDSIVAAFGAGLATGVSVAGTVPLPTNLLGTTVKVKDSLGTERLAPLFFVSGGQINLQIPPGTANGAATVTVNSGSGAVSVGTISVARTAPGVFTANAGGTGLAAAQALRVKADSSLVYEPVAQYDQGQARFIPIPIDLGPPSDQVFLVLFGTGVRNRIDITGVSATIGGSAVNVLYAGLAPGYVGLDQINLPLSRSLIGRGEVTVLLTVEGRPANPVTVKIK